MEENISDKRIRKLDNYTLYAANAFVKTIKSETSEMVGRKYNDLIENAPYDTNDCKFETLDDALAEAGDRSSNVFFQRTLDNELTARLVTYPNTDTGTGEKLAQDYPELTGEDMRALKEQKGRDKKMVEEQQQNQQTPNKASTDLKKAYAQAKTNQQQAFSGVDKLRTMRK